MEPDTHPLFDAHCHIQLPRSPDPEAVVARMRARHIRHAMCCAVDDSEWDRLLGLAARHPDALCISFGVHPWFRPHQEAWLDLLRAQLTAHPEVGVGEIGLDFSPGALRDWSREQQEEVFVQQLRLARELRRPASVHCVQAIGRMLELCRQVGPFDAGLVLHSYAGSAEMVQPFAELGAYFSFSAPGLDPRRAGSRAAIQAVPADRLLIESDAPDQSPPAFVLRGMGLDFSMPEGGKRPVNEPAFLSVVLGRAAEARGCCAQEVAAATFSNACRVFGPCMAASRGAV